MALFPAANAPRFVFKAGGLEMMVAAFTIEESISQPFTAELELASEEEVQFEAVVGKPALLDLQSPQGDRCLHGIVARFVQTGATGRFFTYKAHIVPQFQLLSLEQDCRIFQDMSVPDIVDTVLKDSGWTADLYTFRLQGTYAVREYCVQYRESDLAFISRLLEQEGIFYFFEHSEDNHLLVFGDGTVNYQPISATPRVIFNPGSGMTAEEESIIAFHVARQVRTGKYSLRDFNFEKPALDLSATHGDDQREVYDYPGAYCAPEDGRRLARVRLEQSVMEKEQARGKSVVPRFAPGFTFSLDNHDFDNLNKEYLLTGVRHRGAQPQVLAEHAAGARGTEYENEFWAIPASTVFRPPVRTAKPGIDGVQTAIVTGPSGEQIHTDRHGRVKVQFHWDRLGRKDERSSCWIRVSQLWAGAGWGAMFIPRIGQEVIVSFIEGDPDRPIITGRVYHGENLPPYDLPAEKTKSTIKSDTTPGGNGANELRFEDKKGSEEVYLHGRKDWTIVIENDKTQRIGHDESLDVANNRSKRVGVNQSVSIGANHTETIGANKTETVSINKAETIGAAKELTIGGLYQISVGAAMNETVAAAKTEEVGLTKAVFVGVNMTEKVLGKRSITVDKDMATTVKHNSTLTSKTITFEADDEIVFKTGEATISMRSSGEIVIKGTTITESASGEIVIKGAKTSIN